MPSKDLNFPVNTQNRDPRVACALVLDVSSSMSGAPIAALTQGFSAFIEAVKSDPLARKRAEVAVVTFGSTPALLVPFQEAQHLQPTEFVASGSTDMAGGINLALDELENRKAQYKAEDLEYFRPWLFLLTDGAPNSGGFEEALNRLNRAEGKKGVTVFAVGVGEQVNWDTLNRVSTERQALKLNGLAFGELFRWLSASLSSVSASANYGSNDASHETQQSQIPLPPPGWAAVS